MNPEDSAIDRAEAQARAAESKPVKREKKRE